MCKPGIRKGAKAGDYVLAFAGKTNVFGATPGHLVYAARVGTKPSRSATTGAAAT